MGFRAKLGCSHAGADGPQQERRKVRMIGGFGVSLALRASWFSAADRRHARDRRRCRWFEGLDRGFRLRLGATAGTSRFALAARLAAPARSFAGMSFVRLIRPVRVVAD